MKVLEVENKKKFMICSANNRVCLEYRIVVVLYPMLSEELKFLGICILGLL